MAKSRKQKPRIICPFCKERSDNGNYRAFAVSGIGAHIRFKHPERYEEFTTHRVMFIDRFSCDEEGNPTSGQPIEIDIPYVAPEVISESEPVGSQEVISEPEESAQKPEPKAPQKEKFQDDPEPKPDRYVFNLFGFSDD